MSYELLLKFIILVLAIPIGYLLSYMCKEELAQGKKWFKSVIIIAIIGVIISFIMNEYTLLLSSLFALIVFSVILIRTR